MNIDANNPTENLRTILRLWLERIEKGHAEVEEFTVNTENTETHLIHDLKVKVKKLNSFAAEKQSDEPSLKSHDAHPGLRYIKIKEKSWIIQLSNLAEEVGDYLIAKPTVISPHSFPSYSKALDFARTNAPDLIKLAHDSWVNGYSYIDIVESSGFREIK